MTIIRHTVTFLVLYAILISIVDIIFSFMPTWQGMNSFLYHWDYNEYHDMCYLPNYTGIFSLITLIFVVIFIMVSIKKMKDV